jgi:hypothetical protein
MRAPLIALAALLASGMAMALPFKAQRARLAILDLALDDAASIIEGDDSPEVALERGRLGLYLGDCDAAQRALERPDLHDDDELAALTAVAKGCARATAGTIELRDETRGVMVRFQDDEDRALFPMIVEVAARARDMLARELGVRLPDPVRIDLVRDQFSLAAHTGLPEKAAQTTGTVAVAKWGRVIMISPRASAHGYPWQDTLAHELTHLVISQATRDRAPLWLQEGVAKRQEIRWRNVTPFDGVPSHDSVAWDGIQRGIALPLTGLGRSIAMLPSPEQATVAFAEVASFIAYWVQQNGEAALPKLLEAIRDMPADGDVSQALEKVSGATLATWDDRWRGHLGALAPALPASVTIGFDPPQAREVARRARLGELLLGRGHHHGAAIELSRAHAALPSDATVRCLFADALRGRGDEVDAAGLVDDPQAIVFPTGRWWSLHDFFTGREALPHARMHAVGHAPYVPSVACHELPWGEYPHEPVARALCEAALRLPPAW